MKKCPFCAEEIQTEAVKCKHCGSSLDQPASKSTSKNGRKCLQCGYSGPMKTWLRNYNAPQLIALIGLLFYLIPGLVFIVWGWGKYKCPSCGELAKNVKS